jgi:hypothetical protein
LIALGQTGFIDAKSSHMRRRAQRPFVIDQTGSTKFNRAQAFAWTCKAKTLLHMRKAPLAGCFELFYA